MVCQKLFRLLEFGPSSGYLEMTRYASYEDAHELSCEAIAAASPQINAIAYCLFIHCWISFRFAEFVFSFKGKSGTDFETGPHRLLCTSRANGLG